MARVWQHVVVVAPADALTARGRLFAALERAFDVRFEARESQAPGQAEGVMTISCELDRGSSSGGSDRLELTMLEAEEPHTGASEQVSLVDSTQMDARLRGRRLGDGYAGRAPSVLDAGADALAVRDGHPVWTRRETSEARTDLVSLCPAELGEEESLRNRLRAGRFLALLPMVDFLRELTRDSAWTPPALRAAFIMDDPNLHHRTYGHLNYSRLAKAAETDGYHVAMATIPLDSWFVDRRAARIFARHGRALSLLCHGNDHLRHELAQPRREEDARDMLAQALRRIVALERRSGVVVDRVMAAPHERCSEVSARWMRRLGFEALCNSRPYPWRDSPPSGRPLAGWMPAELIAGGLPVIPRYHLAHPRDDLFFRAYLDQPLILFGHHEDVVDGLGPLSEAAHDVNTCGSVRWESLADIAAANFSTRQEGAVLAIRMYSRAINVTVPEGVTAIRVETPDIHGNSEWDAVATEESRQPLIEAESGWASPPIPVPAPGMLRVGLKGREDMDAASAPTPRWRFRPLMRRGFTEARDRLAPGLRRGGVPAPRPRAGAVDMGLAPRPDGTD